MKLYILMCLCVGIGIGIGLIAPDYKDAAGMALLAVAFLLGIEHIKHRKD